MLELACRFGEGPIDLREIAGKQNISPKYLEQVIIPLRASGLVKSVRGSRGGYSLAKHPSEITVNDVIEVLEGPIDLIECLKDARVCQRSSFCVTRDLWEEVSRAIDGIFRSITFEEMVRRQREKEGRSSPTYQI